MQPARTLAALAVVAVTCATSLGVLADATPQPSQEIKRVPVTRLYKNTQYGFGVPMLPGIPAYRDAPPSPNHGLVYLLGEARTISVSAVYDAASYGSTKAQLDHWLEGEHPDSVKRTPARLGGKPAEQAILLSGKKVTRVVVQRRGENGGILYEVTLETVEGNRPSDFVAFDRVLKGFKRYPLEK